jgi:hypothetical protein
MFSPVRTRRCTVLADARPDGALPPLVRAQIVALDAPHDRRQASETRVGAEVPTSASADPYSWKIWLPLALVPIGGLVGFGAATLVGLKACSRMAITLGGGLALGAAGAATISLASRSKS